MVQDFIGGAARNDDGGQNFSLIFSGEHRRETRRGDNLNCDFFRSEPRGYQMVGGYKMNYSFGQLKYVSFPLSPPTSAQLSVSNSISATADVCTSFDSPVK